MKVDLTEFFKAIADKYLIRAILSGIIAVAVFLFTPEENWILEKLGKAVFVLFISGALFIIISFLVVCYDKIQKWKRRIGYKHASKISDAIREKEQVEKLWEDVDRMTPEDRALLLQFIKSNNAPYAENRSVYRCGNSLLTSEWVISADVYTGRELPCLGPSGKPVENLPKELQTYKETVTQYKLRDDVFNFLKYSYEKYGRISHFE